MAIAPGQILRKKREEMKLSLEQAAQETNIRIQFLQAIEEDRMGAISSQAQLRGFMRLYASYLGLNPLNIIETTPQIEEPIKQTDELANPIERPAQRSEPDSEQTQVEPQKSVLDLFSKYSLKKSSKATKPVHVPAVQE
ncbi:MAG: helix-turn-helix transcriptional regulator, partial [Anaerolineaceae bacterium]|nr:helix-turn-helix transcriptional regulator [Anaerolineaceae bacterium]